MYEQSKNLYEIIDDMYLSRAKRFRIYNLIEMKEISNALKS